MFLLEIPHVVVIIYPVQKFMSFVSNLVWDFNKNLNYIKQWLIEQDLWDTFIIAVIIVLISLLFGLIVKGISVLIHKFKANSPPRKELGPDDANEVPHHNVPDEDDGDEAQGAVGGAQGQGAQPPQNPPNQEEEEVDLNNNDPNFRPPSPQSPPNSPSRTPPQSPRRSPGSPA